MTYNHDKAKVTCPDCAREVERLRAELTQCKADAERYRWLCNGNGYFMEENFLCGHDNQKHQADKEIDDAMQGLR